jgi:hypothetical protein
MIEDEGGGEDGGGGSKSLLDALTELSQQGPFGDLRRAYEAFLEENRDQLDEETYRLLQSRDWAEIYRRLQPRGGYNEMNVLCIIC